jgi:hypothetical protein
MPTYTIERDLNDHRKVKPWLVLKDGVVMNHHNCLYVEKFSTRKDAQKRIDDDIAGDAYLVRLHEQDTAAVRTWTPEEKKEISDFAVILTANEERFTFHGKLSIQAISRGRHVKDAKDLATNHWIDPKRLHAELRRNMAARVEAFKCAGLTL